MREEYKDMYTDKKVTNINDKEMVKYKKGFLAKIKQFFINLFTNISDKNLVKSEENILDKNVFKNSKNEFLEVLKVDKLETSIFEKTEFLKKIEGNYEILNRLSIDRLKKLEKYYDNIIEKNEKIINELKKF